MGDHSAVLVRDAMATPPVTVLEDTDIKQATELLARHAITAMPVLDHGGRLVGVISEADVLQDAYLGEDPIRDVSSRLTAGPRRVLVGDVMNRHPISVPADASLAEATELMLATTVKSLPVTEHGRVIGMLSRRDMVERLARPDELVEAEIDELLRRSGKEWTVEVADGVAWLEGPVTEADHEFASGLVGHVCGVVGIYVRGTIRAGRP